MDPEALSLEESLDPENWAELRELGHRMVDDMLDFLATTRERPVWQPTPPDVQAALCAPLPTTGRPASEVYEDFLQQVLPYSMGNTSPRFWGWVMGNGTPLAMLAEMLAAGVNPNMGGGDHSGTRVELQVIDWCKQMLGYPAGASGLLVSGGSMANLLGLAIARSAGAGFDVRQDGLAAAPRPLTLYGSEEMHSSVQRAAEVLGLGNRALRRIPVREDYRIDTQALRAAIADDKAAGNQPIGIVACAGTVNTGAMDPLEELADIAAEHGLWYHVDGAFGAMAALSPALRARLKGMERADSLAFDLHKWGYLPFEIGVLLVRDEEAHRRTFSLMPDYLKHGGGRGPAGGPTWFSDYGIQLTRGFRALKAWMALKAYGTDQLARVIEQNVAQARYLAGLVEASPSLELLAPAPLNIVCFRYRAPRLDEEGLNALNTELLLRLQESGAALPTSTMLRGRYAIRCAITNHRSRRADFDGLVAEVTRLGNGLVKEQGL